MAHEPLRPHRVAIYAAPDPESDAWARGSAWLGRCALRRWSLPQPAIDGLDPASQAALTADPRRYGWHATLKAPMRLADAVDLQALRDAVTALCQAHRVLPMPALQVSRLGRFLALRPAHTPAALSALADDCVRRLQPLAAPLSANELVRRRRAPLTPEEDALLLAWGYPWVLQKFRFHFSLTGPLDDVPEATIRRVQQAAEAHFAALPPWRLDRLSIFIEPAPGADFLLLEQPRLAP